MKVIFRPVTKTEINVKCRTVTTTSRTAIQLSLSRWLKFAASYKGQNVPKYLTVTGPCSRSVKTLDDMKYSYFDSSWLGQYGLNSRRIIRPKISCNLKICSNRRINPYPANVENMVSSYQS